MNKLGFLKKIRALKLLDNSFFLHYLKLRYKAHLFSIFIMHFKLSSCILSSEYVIHWKQKSLGKEVGVTWKS